MVRFEVDGHFVIIHGLNMFKGCKGGVVLFV